MTFRECVLECAKNMELVKSFDRLKGTNLSQRGSQIELMVDQATGRYKKEAIDFINFVYEVVWIRLPESSKQSG